MKILKNEVYKNQEGGNVYLSAEQEKAKKPADTLTVLEGLLKYGEYESGAEILQAAEVKEKLKLNDGYIKLEDADFNFIKSKAENYQPLLKSGLVFSKFYKALNSPLTEEAYNKIQEEQNSDEGSGDTHKQEIDVVPEEQVQKGETADSFGKEIK